MASEVVGGGGRSGGMGRMGGGVGGGRDGRGWVLRHQLQVGRAVVRHEIKIKPTSDPLSISKTHKVTDSLKNASPVFRDPTFLSL